MNEIASSTVSSAEVPAGLFRPRLRERLFRRWFAHLRFGRLHVDFPSGARHTFVGTEPGPQAAMTIHDMGLVTRMMMSGDIGFAESYVAGEWDTPDLSAVLMLGARNQRALSDALGRSWLATVLNRLRHARRANTRAGSRRNIAAHYDLGNDFYGLWLDPTMTYSSASTPPPPTPTAAAPWS